jgi:hypothetical protein
MTTNNHECLNNIFKEAMELLVTSVVEITFYKSVKYFTERREKNAEYMVHYHLVFVKKKVKILLEARRLKRNTNTITSYRDKRKYEIVTNKRLEGNRVKGGKGH